MSIVGDTFAHDAVVKPPNLQPLLYSLGRLHARFNCQLEGFANHPDFTPYVQLIADQHRNLYAQNVLRKATLVRDESEAYNVLTEVTGEKANRHQHISLRAELFRVFDQAFSSVDDEHKLRDWTEDMGQFLTKVYDGEVRKALTTASGFWLRLAKRFERAHQQRLKEFPE